MAIYLGLAAPRACMHALGACLVAMGAGTAAFFIAKRRMGGVNADVLGFALEVCEVAACVAVLLSST